MKKLILLGLISAFADCSAMDDSRRQFAGIESRLRERLPFEANKLPSSTSKIFERAAYDHSDKLSAVCAFPDSGKIAVQIEQVREDEESPIFLVMQQEVSKSSHLKTLPSLKDVLGKEYSRLKFVSVPDGVEELCEECFRECRSLTRVTFEENSSLKIIGARAFAGTGLSEIHIPDGVEELCDACFYKCTSLSRVTFGENSSLKIIGKWAFSETGLSEIHIPDGVEELHESCFHLCQSLSRVIFGENSSLKLIGKLAFFCSALREIHIPDAVEELCDACFYFCESLSRVTFGVNPSLKRIGAVIFFDSAIREIHLPNSLREICDNAFANTKLRNVNVGESTIWSVDSSSYEDIIYKYDIVWRLKSKNGENSWVTTNIAFPAYYLIGADDPEPTQIMQLVGQAHND